MSANPPVACKNASTGCGGYVVERGLCAACLKANPQAANKPAHAPLRWKQHSKRDEVDLSYRHADWVRFSKAARAYNPLCQNIDANGVRCNRASKDAHHIVSPRVAPERRLDPSNVACLCRDHHDNTEGESIDSNRTLAPTRWRTGIGPIVEYEHNRPAPRKPGDVVIGENGVAL
jgi:hypothetical protein